MTSNYWFGIGSLMSSRNWGIKTANSTMEEDLSRTTPDQKGIDCRYILRQFVADRIACFITGAQCPDRSIESIQATHIHNRLSGLQKSKFMDYLSESKDRCISI